MFKFFKKINKDKKGMTLVIAITTMTLLLSLSLSISNIVLRQIRITNLNNSSKPAFFIADSAAECAMYFDTLFVASTTDPLIDMNKDFSTAIFGPNILPEDMTGKVPCGIQIMNVSKDISNPIVSITNFDIDYGNFCAKVTVTKTDVDTEIVSRGYNTKAKSDFTECDLSDVDSRRLVERGLTIKY